VSPHGIATATCIALLAALASNVLAHTTTLLASPTWTWTLTPPLTSTATETSDPTLDLAH